MISTDHHDEQEMDEDSLKLSDILRAPNVAELLSEEERTEIAGQVYNNWLLDKQSRQPWEEKMAEALKLALQVSEAKTFPWPDCANVKFPLITIAALQFHARAYSALIPGTDVVKCRTFGTDPDGLKAARAARVSSHMSYQVLEEDEGWEENHDRVLITAPIVGCAFKKSQFDPLLGHSVTSHVLAANLYIPYYAATLETASRITELLFPSSNAMESWERRGLFLEGSCERVSPQSLQRNALTNARAESQGITEASQDPATPFELLEQHTWLDLDGDGLQEPYIVTVRMDTQKLCRIVARFRSTDVKRVGKKIYDIAPTHHYTKYPFIPSPDGGIYDLGWGVLLGPLNDSINTIINQLLDAGTMATTAGGFLGRGARLRSGDNAFKPFEWKRVDASGDDLRKNIVPHVPKEPSQVLFALLQLLISYGERVAGVTDQQVGVSPGQNTPAETSRNVISEGQKVFQGILKRFYRSMKQEFRKLYKLNKIYFPGESADYYNMKTGESAEVLAQDYLDSEKSICPAADPNMLSDGARLQQVQFLKQSAATTAGYDAEAVERRVLEAMQVSDVAAIYPGPKKMPPPQDTRLQIEQMKLQGKQLDMQVKLKIAALTLLGDADLNQAKISQLQADATLKLSQAAGAETGQQIAVINAQIGAAKAHQDSLLRAAKLLQEAMNQKDGTENGTTTAGQGTGMGGMAAQSGDSGVSQLLAGAGGAGDAGLG